MPTLLFQRIDSIHHRFRLCRAALLLLLALPSAVRAEDYTYTISNGTVTITKYIGPGGAVSIPGTIAGLPVTTIGSGAFFYCSNLTSVTIPASVTSIVDNPFYVICNQLTSITVDPLNSSYSSSDGVLFNKLKTTIIVYPKNKVGNYIIPSSVTSIGDHAFEQSLRLDDIVIPNGVTSIGYMAFHNCPSLKTVTFSASVTSIGVWAFEHCDNLSQAIFLGNAPPQQQNFNWGVGSGTVYFYPGTTGWGGSAWAGWEVRSITTYPPWAATSYRDATSGWIPLLFSEHSLCHASGFLYHTGGWSANFGESNKALYSQVQANGTVDNWNTTSPLPDAVLDHAGVAANGFVYVLGGNHVIPDGSDWGSHYEISNVVYYAKINADGSLGPWLTASPLPQPIFWLSASAWNGRIYVIGGWNGSSLSNAVYSANIQTDGSLSPWVVQRVLPDAVYTQAQVSNGLLYVLGGMVNGATQVQNNVYYTRINVDGTLAPWNAGTPLPLPLANFGAVASGGRIYITGGWNGATQTKGFYSAPVGANGAIGSWSANTPLPLILHQHAMASSEQHIFLSGGVSNIGVEGNVYSKPLLPLLSTPDILPPRTTLTIGTPKFGTTPFISRSTPLSLSAVDDSQGVGDGLGIGVASTHWALDGGGFTASTNFTVPTDGSHWISYYSDDTLGNVETIQSVAVAVDGTAPVSALAVGSPKAVLGTGDIVVTSATPLSVTAQDPVTNGVASGVDQMFYGLAGAADVPFLTPFTLPNVEGAHAIKLLSSDHTQNHETEHTQTVYLDATPPATSVHTSQPAVQGGDGGPPVLPAGALISFTAADPVSNGTAAGVNHTEYSINNGPTLSYSAAFGIGDGITTLRYRSIDNVGNTEGWITVSYRGGTSFDSWRSAHFTAAQLNNPAISGPNANPAGDGVTNLAKYALAMDPWVSSRQGWPTGSVSNNHLVMEYTQVTAATDVTYAPQKSTGLSGPWIAATDEILPRGVHATTQTLRIRNPDLVSQTPSGFMRLGLSLNAAAVQAPQAMPALTNSLASGSAGVTAGRIADQVQPVVSSDVRVALPVVPAERAPVAAPPDGPAPDFGRGNRRVAMTTFPHSHSSAHAAISTLTPQGGEVHAKDGGGVIIPPGAMTASRSITVAPLPADTILPQNFIPVGRGVRIGPAGARFEQPVTIELPYQRAGLPAGVMESDLAIHAWNPETRVWEVLPSAVDMDHQIVRAQTGKFTLCQIMVAKADR